MQAISRVKLFHFTIVGHFTINRHLFPLYEQNYIFNVRFCTCSIDYLFEENYEYYCWQYLRSTLILVIYIIDGEKWKKTTIYKSVDDSRSEKRRSRQSTRSRTQFHSCFKYKLAQDHSPVGHFYSVLNITLNSTMVFVCDDIGQYNPSFLFLYHISSEVL